MPKGEAATATPVKQTVKKRVGDGTPGPGRPKGVPNKTTRAAKEAFALAFEGIGGVSALKAWAEENPGEFFKLYAKLIPLDVTTNGKELRALSWSFGGREVTF